MQKTKSDMTNTEYLSYLLKKYPDDEGLNLTDEEKKKLESESFSFKNELCD